MSTHNIYTEDITLSVFSLFSLMGPLSLCSFHDARCHNRIVSPTMKIVFHAQGSGIQHTGCFLWLYGNWCR